MGVVAADRFLPGVRGREGGALRRLRALHGLHHLGRCDGRANAGHRPGAVRRLQHLHGGRHRHALAGACADVRAQPGSAGRAAAWERLPGLEACVGFMVNPFCVVMLCLWLDRFTYSRDLALYTETRRAEAERARADEVLRNALPPAVAEELKRHRKVRARKFGNLGVLFADIVGFTRYVETALAERWCWCSTASSRRSTSWSSGTGWRRSRRSATPTWWRRFARAATVHAVPAMALDMRDGDRGSTTGQRHAACAHSHRHPHGAGRGGRDGHQAVPLRRVGRHGERRQPDGIHRASPAVSR